MDKLEIKKNKLILVEGKDAFWFFIAVLKEKGLIEDKQVMDFGGITELESFLQALMLVNGFDDVETIVIVRDAELNAGDAQRSIHRIVKKNLKIELTNPFEFINDQKKVAYMLFPGYDEAGNLRNGTLEDLCLSMVDENHLLNSSKEFIDTLSEHNSFKYLHKTQLHTYLSINDSYVGSKLGEASRIGAWNWDHSNFSKYLEVIKEM